MSHLQVLFLLLIKLIQSEYLPLPFLFISITCVLNLISRYYSLGSGSSTSNMRKHLERDHDIVLEATTSGNGIQGATNKYSEVGNY
jgi:hypothetical protein